MLNILRTTPSQIYSDDLFIQENWCSTVSSSNKMPKNRYQCLSQGFLWAYIAQISGAVEFFKKI